MFMPVQNKGLSTSPGLQAPSFRKMNPTGTSQDKNELFPIASSQNSLDH